MKQLLDAYYQARVWYEKAQPTDCTMDSMYNQGRVVVKGFLDAFEAVYCSPQTVPSAPVYPLMPTYPYQIPLFPSLPVWPGNDFTCATRNPN